MFYVLFSVCKDARGMEPVLNGIHKSYDTLPRSRVNNAYPL
jgi:hypothetical protein